MAIIDVRAPMAGSVFEVACNVGDVVNEGDELIILESMKMEIPVAAESSGRVAEILISPSTSVEEGDVLLRIEVA
jgi:acetyl-CoA carboxylase biotin carboxyl carrier protein